MKLPVSAPKAAPARPPTGFSQVDRFEARPSPQKPPSGGAAGKAPDFGGLKDSALIKAIHDYASKHQTVSYSQARKIIFGQLDNHGGKVRDVYTGREIVTKVPPASSNMNVEHTWPRSRGVKGTPAESDLHHLFPTDSKANSIRSSYPFGEVEKVKWSQGGSRFGTDKSGNVVFEPPDEHKGNVARALFYVSTTYGLRIPPAEEAVLKQWNKLDQVDAAERTRNDAIERIQRNRNVFVDNPALADRIADF